MSKHEGKPLAVDRHAASASPTEPAFVARPSGAPVYHGFRVLEDVTVEGSCSVRLRTLKWNPVRPEMRLLSLPMAAVLASYGKLEQEETSTGFTFGTGAVGCLGCLVPARNEDPRRSTEQPCFCIAGLEGSLGRMEAVVSCVP